MQGENGKLELAIVGFADTFEISPSIVNQDAQFVINVKNNKRLDFEQVRQMNFKIVAQELGVNNLMVLEEVCSVKMWTKTSESKLGTPKS